MPLLSRVVPLTQVADGIHINAMQSRAKRLANDLHRDRIAARSAQQSLPPLFGEVATRRRHVLEKLRGNALANDVGQRMTAEVQRQLIGVEQGVGFGDHKGFVVSANVQGFPRRGQ